ncbi:MAG: hypothetical protein JST66_06955, partial [Bacteroidetes bacterium]|nr:hypothetical protein [Bacteroidota bacterium]
MNNHDPARIHPARHGRRRWLALLAGTSLIATVSAQNVSLYSFSSGTGTTLDPMSGASTLLGANQDDNASAVTNIGFSFNYEGTNYTQFSINSNGGLKLGGTPIGGSAINFNLTSNPLVLLPYSGDGTTANGSVTTVLTGTSPNQVRVVQWNAGMDYNVSSANILYQVWLHEGTNAIEFRYGPGAPTGTNSGGMQVAITGATATNYLNVLSNLTASSSSTTQFSTSTANGWPGNGTILTFSPPAPCTVPTPGNTVASVTSGCPGLITALSLSTSTAGSGVSYQWESSPDGSSWSPIGGAISATYTTGALNTTTWYQCQVTCATGPATVASTPVQITVSEPAMSYYTYAGTLVTENFNSWTNRCSTGDVPNGATSGYWRNYPSFGPGTWRAGNTTTGNSGWSDTGGGTGVATSTTVTSNPNALAVTQPAARFHSRQGSSVVGTLDFYVNMSAATGAEKLRFEYINAFGPGSLGVYISTNGGANFTQVGSTLTSTSSNWAVQEFTIGSTSATTVIRLQGTAGVSAGSGNDLGVDNFRIIPAITCVAPTAPTASVTGPGSVNIGWTCASCTGDFYVEYKNASFTPGTGATAGGGTVAGPFTSSPATLSGLPVGNYTAYVRRDCGGGNGFSENVGPVTFGIVNGDFCANAIDLSTASHADWTVVANTTGASNDYTSSACASQPGPDVVLFHDVAPGATLSLGLWSSSNRMSVAYGSVCPGTTNLACSSAGYFTVGGSVQDIDGFPTLIWTNNGCQTERIHVLADGTSTGGEVYIFNYAYTPAAGPFCPAVTGIAVNTVNTGTGAGLSWNATCSGNVIVEYGPAGFTPGTGASANGGTAVPVSGTSTTLSGLDLDTPYDVYVRQDCGGGTFSANGSATSFTLHNGDDCSRVLALIGESGSLTLNTTGANNDISVCGAGNTGGDLVLSYVVQPGYGIYFASAPSAPYSGQVRIAYGNACPGGTEVYCQAGAVDQFWLNETGDVQTVYLIQDGTDEGSTTVEWSYFPACALLDTDGDGINDCDDSCPELPGGVGDPCTIGGNPGTISEGCTCVAAACTGNQAVVVIRTDANGSQTTWQIQDAFAFTVASGGPYTGQDNTVISTNVCLPTTFGSC